jgi:hypothetical protein
MTLPLTCAPSQRANGISDTFGILIDVAQLELAASVLGNEDGIALHALTQI